MAASFFTRSVVERAVRSWDIQLWLYKGSPILRSSQSHFHSESGNNFLEFRTSFQLVIYALHSKQIHWNASLSCQGWSFPTGEMWRRTCCIAVWHSVLAMFYLACTCHDNFRCWSYPWNVSVIDWLSTNNIMAVMSRALAPFKPFPAFFVNLASCSPMEPTSYLQTERASWILVGSVKTPGFTWGIWLSYISELDWQTCRLCDFRALGGTIRLQEDDLCHVWHPASSSHRWAQVPHRRKTHVNK